MQLKMRYQVEVDNTTLVAKIKYDHEFSDYRVWIYENGSPMYDKTIHAISPEDAAQAAKKTIGWGPHAKINSISS